ncbi:MAG: hypothetical protein B2I17_10065 [Thermoplasmatales archaeon B_DKE]|nr:MAG: hypothetical protein B2I17_10065 [Thermoplasmatales archaeon B_DKE]
MSGDQDPRMYEIGFREGIRTAMNLFQTRGYDRALKALERILEESQSRHPGSSINAGGPDTSKEVK